MKIIVEKNIPYIQGLLEPFGTVDYLSANEITADTVRDADALFVRTRTKCNAALLEGSRVKFIATATIGTDHIDLPYCREKGITVRNAPGCNAPAVAQYVFATIARWMEGKPMSPRELTLGVIGVGNVGKIIVRWARNLGFNVLECDPPRQRAEGGSFVSLDEIARTADIITFHTPLNREGIDRTFHLADSKFLENLGHCRLLINSSRGEVVDNAALLRALENGSLEAAAVDCWENEPDIDRRLLDKVFVATPHIAGYSAEGKTRATAMALEAFEKFYGVTVAGKPVAEAPKLGADVSSLTQIAATYNPLDDTATLRRSPETFEAQRNHYALRAEVQ